MPTRQKLIIFMLSMLAFVCFSAFAGQDGECPAVSVNSNGLVVEMHVSSSSNTIWGNIGYFTKDDDVNTVSPKVTWVRNFCTDHVGAHDTWLRVAVNSKGQGLMLFKGDDDDPHVYPFQITYSKDQSYRYRGRAFLKPINLVRYSALNLDVHGTTANSNHELSAYRGVPALEVDSNDQFILIWTAKDNSIGGYNISRSEDTWENIKNNGWTYNGYMATNYNTWQGTGIDNYDLNDDGGNTLNVIGVGFNGQQLMYQNGVDDVFRLNTIHRGIIYLKGKTNIQWTKQITGPGYETVGTKMVSVGDAGTLMFGASLNTNALSEAADALESTYETNGGEIDEGSLAADLTAGAVWGAIKIANAIIGESTTVNVTYFDKSWDSNKSWESDVEYLTVGANNYGDFITVAVPTGSSYELKVKTGSINKYWHGILGWDNPSTTVEENDSDSKGGAPTHNPITFSNVELGQIYNGEIVSSKQDLGNYFQTFSTTDPNTHYLVYDGQFILSFRGGAIPKDIKDLGDSYFVISTQNSNVHYLIKSPNVNSFSFCGSFNGELSQHIILDWGPYTVNSDNSLILTVKNDDEYYDLYLLTDKLTKVERDMTEDLPEAVSSTSLKIKYPDDTIWNSKTAYEITLPDGSNIERTAHLSQYIAKNSFNPYSVFVLIDGKSYSVGQTTPYHIFSIYFPQTANLGMGFINEDSIKEVGDTYLDQGAREVFRTGIYNPAAKDEYVYVKYTDKDNNSYTYRFKYDNIASLKSQDIECLINGTWTTLKKKYTDSKYIHTFGEGNVPAVSIVNVQDLKDPLIYIDMPVFHLPISNSSLGEGVSIQDSYESYYVLDYSTPIIVDYTNYYGFSYKLTFSKTQQPGYSEVAFPAAGTLSGKIFLKAEYEINTILTNLTGYKPISLKQNNNGLITLTASAVLPTPVISYNTQTNTIGLAESFDYENFDRKYKELVNSKLQKQPLKIISVENLQNMNLSGTDFNVVVITGKTNNPYGIYLQENGSKYILVKKIDINSALGVSDSGKVIAEDIETNSYQITAMVDGIGNIKIDFNTLVSQVYDFSNTGGGKHYNYPVLKDNNRPSITFSTVFSPYANNLEFTVRGKQLYAYVVDSNFPKLKGNIYPIATIDDTLFNQQGDYRITGNGGEIKFYRSGYVQSIEFGQSVFLNAM